ncbi:MAG: tape measure protein [Phascolarctobacterium sp.]|nr:tape measure protein [Phascolarctobacterium sp.]
MADKDINVKITADTSDVDSKVGKVGKKLKSVGKEAEDAIASVDRSLKGISAAAVGTAIGTIILKIGELGFASIKSANQMRQYEIAFSTMLKSADKGRAILQDLQRFAAETPFDVPGVVQSAQQLMAFGFAADEIIPTLRILGDAAAGLGKSSAGVQQIAYALGQIRTSGTLKTQDVNQLTNAGINAWEALAQASGKSIREIKEATEKGMIDSAKAIEVITASMADNFGGMMETRSKEVDGYWNNIIESVGNAQATLGSFATESDDVKEALKGVSDEASDISNALMEAKNAGKSFGEALKEAVPPEVLVAVGSLTAIVGTGLVAALVAATGALASFLGLTAPVVAAVAGVGAMFTSAFVNQDEHIQNAVDELRELRGGTDDYVDALQKAIDARKELASYSTYDSDYHDQYATATPAKQETNFFADTKNLSDYQKELRKISEEYGLTERGIREVAAANAELQDVKDALARATMNDRDAQKAYYQDQINAINAAKEADKQATAEKIAGLEAQKKIWEEARAVGIDGSDEKLTNLEKQIALEQQLLGIRQETAELQVQEIETKVKDQEEMLSAVSEAWLNYGRSVASGFGDAVVSIVDGSKSASKAFGDMVRDMLTQSLNLLAQWTAVFGLVSAWKGPVKGAEAANKMVLGLATGGYVTGAGTSTSDSIPAMLSNGEYVMQASAVRRIGVPALNAMNAGRGFADGGLVAAKPVSVGGAGGSNNSVTINVSTLDAASFEEALRNGGLLEPIKQALFDSDRNFAASAGVW